MRLAAASGTLVPAPDRPYLISLKLTLINDEPIPLDIEKVFSPRASLAGSEQPYLPVRASVAGAPAFPIRAFSGVQEIALEIETSAPPRSGDWLLLHFMLATGNRLAFRLDLSVAPDGTVQTKCSALADDRTRFRVGFGLTLLFLAILRIEGSALATDWFDGALSIKEVATLLFGALLGATALPSLFSFNEFAALWQRPETRVASPLFFAMSRRSWAAAALVSSVALLVGATLFKTYSLPALEADELAWYTRDSDGPVDRKHGVWRFSFDDVFVAVKPEHESPPAEIGRLPLHPWGRLLLRSSMVKQLKPKYRTWRVKIDADVAEALGDACLKSHLEALANADLSAPDLLKNPCLQVVRTQVLDMLRGDSPNVGPEGDKAKPWILEESGDKGALLVRHRGYLTRSDLQSTISGWLVSASFRSPSAATMKDLPGAFPAPVLPTALAGRKVGVETFINSLRDDLLARWEEPSPGRPGRGQAAVLSRNAILVHLAGTMVEFAVGRLNDPEADRDKVLRATTNLLRERLYFSSERGPAPRSSTGRDALEAFFSFLVRWGAEIPRFQTEALLQAADSGDPSNAAFLRAVASSRRYLAAATSLPEEPGKPSARRLLVDHFGSYWRRRAKFPLFARTFDELLARNDATVDPMILSFLNDIEVAL
ncbi:MAG: hypothetical protein IPJ17_02665 [Holophagales bacterium]|nr:MAG: hypothetical protein IPJ17_02665 [Holophagales bacterium]